MKKALKIIIPILLLCAAILGVGWYLAQSRLSRVNRVEPANIVKVDPSSEDFEVDEELVKKIQESEDVDVVDPEEIDWGDADIQVMQDKDVVNLLLIGQDRREGQGRQRSDTMIICSINKKRDVIVLNSIMRDLYVPIPGYSDNRINAAYQFGGMPLLDQVIEESLGIHIDGNIEVDFDGFLEAMIELGNLDIELKKEEADYLNAHTDLADQTENGAEVWNLKEGVNSMTPVQLLAYVRTRYVGNSDWERTDRQRRVLMAAFEKAKSEGIKGILSMADKIFPNLTTDMTDAQLLGYVYSVLTGGITDVENYRIPVDGTYLCQTLSVGMEVLVPNLSENSKYLQEYIYG